MTKQEFVEEVTAGLTPPPQYFAKNAMMNKAGYTSFDKVLERGVVALTPDRFEELVESEEALMLDTRHKDDFVQEHIPNSIFIGVDGTFAPWVGALITDIKQPIVLITPEGREEEVVTRLARVGYDNTLGYLAGGLKAWKAAGKETDRTQSITAEELAVSMNKGTLKGKILDVRKPTEFIAQQVVGAENFPLDYINRNMDRLDKQETYYLHCASGFRSVVMASILQARGYRNVVDVKLGWKAIEASEVPKTAYACPSTIKQEEIDAAIAAVI
jgi:rhodanese-related sulfurtransferase